MRSDRERRQGNIEEALKRRYHDACALARVVLPEIMEAPRAADRDQLAEFAVCTFGYPNDEPRLIGERSTERVEGLTDDEFDAAHAEVGEIVETFLASIRGGNGTAADFGSRMVGLLASCPNNNARIYALGMVLQSDVVPFVQSAQVDFGGGLDRALAADVRNRPAVQRSRLLLRRIYQIDGKTRGEHFAAVRRVLLQHRGIEFDYLLDAAYNEQKAAERNNRPALDIMVLGGPGGLLDLGGLLRRRDANGHDERPSLFSGMSAAQIRQAMMDMVGIPEAVFADYIKKHETGSECPGGHDCPAHEYIRLRDAEAAAVRGDEPDGEGRSRADQSRDRV